jgi:hypothetical protein
MTVAVLVGCTVGPVTLRRATADERETTPSPSAEPGALPQHPGVFVFSGGALYELRPESAERQNYVLTYRDRRWWWPMCCERPPQVALPSPDDAELVVFLDGASAMKVGLFRFQFVRRLSHVDWDWMVFPAQKRAGTGNQTLHDPKAWIRSPRGIETTLEPTSRPDVIRVRPAKRLEAGLYSVSIEIGQRRYPETGVFVFALGAGTSATERSCFDWKVETEPKPGWVTTWWPCSMNALEPGAEQRR